MATKQDILFEGKEKRIFSTDEPGTVLIRFNDVVTAFGGIKRARLKDKGKYNNRISSIIFEALTAAGVPNHFISLENDREQLCRKVGIIPLQMIVRNRLAGTTAKLLGVENGTRIPNTVYEIRYNSDAVGDPMINDTHVIALGLLSREELDEVYALALRTNEVLRDLFHRAGIELVDFKMEVGRAEDGRIIISDEISPDNSRLWDEKTGEILDKDRFRHDMSDVCASYREVMDRLMKL